MLASILISAISVVLFAYWFRYSCLLLLRDRTERSLVANERFSFMDVRERLETEPDLHSLQVALERDYRVLTYLLQHAAQLGGQPLEDRLLMMDYRLMRCWYWLTRTAAPAQARRALAEMSEVVAFLAYKMGEQAALAREA
jgi:hypothetical protein